MGLDRVRAVAEVLLSPARRVERQALPSHDNQGRSRAGIIVGRLVERRQALLLFAAMSEPGLFCIARVHRYLICKTMEVT